MWEIVAGGVFGVLAAGLAAQVAAKAALKQWRVEETGRRRVVLAEEVLTAFYKLRDELRSARVHLKGGTGDEAEKDRWEEAIHQQVAELLTKRWQFKALFGEEAAQPFATLRGIEFVTWNEGTKRHPDEPPVLEAVTHIRDGYAPEMDKEMDQLVARIEATCRKEIDAEAQQLSWKERRLGTNAAGQKLPWPERLRGRRG